ncbi:hypothetical protein, partial [Burkholderia sp.]|uniref:hypothetical protein n=1 Tax=Burkholderia sp. TaxID=36773 RepID=UPI00258A7199
MSMPIACEPCPGKTNANFISSPIESIRTARTNGAPMGSARSLSRAADQKRKTDAPQVKPPPTP